MAEVDAGAVVIGADGKARCWWGASPPEYLAYHDEEWGRPVGDDRLLFEKLCLEGFQAGLSWLTILRKRPAFRSAFDGFDIATVGALRRGRRIPPARRSGHRPSSWQDRCSDRQCRLGAASDRGARLARLIRMGLRPRSAREGTDAALDLARVERHEPGSEATRLVALSGRRRCTPSCRQWAWSTITWLVVGHGTRSGRLGPSSCHPFLERTGPTPC